MLLTSLLDDNNNVGSQEKNYSTVEDIGSEEFEDIDVERSPTQSNGKMLLAIENASTSSNPLTAIVYPKQIKLPPGWIRTEANEVCSKSNKLGSKILKSIHIHGTCCRFFLKGKGVFANAAGAISIQWMDYRKSYGLLKV